MTIQQMRAAIAKVYQTESWRKKVKNMCDSQVIAIYYDFFNRKVLNKVLKTDKPVVADNKPKEKCQQLSFFDL